MPTLSREQETNRGPGHDLITFAKEEMDEQRHADGGDCGPGRGGGCEDGEGNHVVSMPGVGSVAYRFAFRANRRVGTVSPVWRLGAGRATVRWLALTIP